MNLLFSEKPAKTAHLVFGRGGRDLCRPDWIKQDALSVDFGDYPDHLKTLSIDFDCESCRFDWTEYSGDNIGVDVYSHADWAPVRGDRIHIRVDCERPIECREDWQASPGDAQDVDFRACTPDDPTGTYWPENPSDLETNFTCCGVEEVESAEISASIPCGENLGSSLDTVLLISSSLHTSETLSVELTTRENIAFAVDLSRGSRLEASLRTHSTLTWEALSGEGVDADISAFVKVSTHLITGEALWVDVRTDPSGMTCSTGEHFAAELDVYATPESSLPSGESISAHLTTRSTIDSDLGVGEGLDVELNTRPQASLVVAINTGESTGISLASQVRLGLALYTGESAIFGFDLAPRAPLEAISCTGEVLWVELSPAHGFAGTLATGEALVITGIDEEHPWRLPSGESIDASLHTIKGLDVVLSSSETLSAILDTRPGEPLAATLYTGESLLPPRPEVQHNPRFSVNLYTGETPAIALNDSTLSYDTRGRAPIDETDWYGDAEYLRVEIDDFPEHYTYSPCPTTWLSADLETKPALSAILSDGSAFTLNRNYELIEYEIHCGEGIAEGEWLYTEPRINLCYPNIFPNPDYVEVELDWSEETCYADYLHTGEWITTDLSIQARCRSYAYAGEHLEAILTPLYPWRINIWVGETLSATLWTEPSLSASLPNGEGIAVRFEPVGAVVRVGESIEATLEIAYYVEFLERGCLENEYIPMNEHGHADLTRFSPMGVEGEWYQHDIKARCF